MKIVVLVKEVPDTYGDRKLDLETGLAERSASERVLDEIGERALEVALSYADAHPGTEVAVVSMASEEAAATIRNMAFWRTISTYCSILAAVGTLLASCPR